MKDLAEQVGLSVTPCIERVKRMERDLVIAGYYARVNPHQLGRVAAGVCRNHPRSQSGNMFEQFPVARCSGFPRCWNAISFPAISII